MTDAKRSKITDENRAEAARLKELWDKNKHRTQAEFGEQYELGNQANVGHYLGARSALNAKAAAAFAAELGCSVADFSPRLAVALAKLAASTPLPGKADRDETTDQRIIQWNTGGRMGNSGVVLRDQPGMIKSWTVSAEWVSKNVHSFTAVRNLAIVTGFGDSMRPLYNPGDPLLIDTGVAKVDFDGIYFFRVGDEGFVKRLQRIPGDGMLVISENDSYRDWTLTEDLQRDFEVFGRVIKVWRGTDF